MRTRPMPVRLAPAVAVTLLAFAGLPACAPGTVAEQRAELSRSSAHDVVVGVAWPWAARREMRFGDGIDMAVAEVNGAGGIGGRTLRVIRLDDHESADEGRLIAQRLGADPEVVAVIGHLQSYVTVPAAAIYDNVGVVLLAPAATDPALTAQGYRHVFRGTFTDKVAGREMADYAARRGYRRIAIQYVRSPYGRDLANAFEEYAADHDLQVVARQSYGADHVADDTFDAVMREWSTLKLDAIFLAGEVPSAAYFVKAARRHGLTVPILGGDALGSPALLAIAGDAADGTVIPSVFHPDEPRAEVARFVLEFKRRSGVMPDAGSALAYDAIRILASAMRDAGSTLPDSVSAALHGMRQWQGVTGPFTFDAAGDVVNKPLVKMVVRDGRFAFLPDEAARATDVKVAQARRP